FEGVLKDTLARIPGEDEMKVQEDVADLKRICCSTAYMFMYSQVGDKVMDKIYLYPGALILMV
ncbi:unnamed protein product, partial [Sphacelaria rigidula]